MFEASDSFEGLEVSVAMQLIFRDVMKTIANEIADVAKENAPVKTGAYRDGIKVKKVGDIFDGGEVYEIVANAKHSSIVEARTGNLQRALGIVEQRMLD